MHSQLREIHENLFNSKRDSNNFAAVLVHGLPGTGKSHFAGQYVFDYAGFYPGGIVSKLIAISYKPGEVRYMINFGFQSLSGRERNLNILRKGIFDDDVNVRKFGYARVSKGL